MQTLLCSPNYTSITSNRVFCFTQFQTLQRGTCLSTPHNSDYFSQQHGVLRYIRNKDYVCGLALQDYQLQQNILSYVDFKPKVCWRFASRGLSLKKIREDLGYRENISRIVIFFEVNVYYTSKSLTRFSEDYVIVWSKLESRPRTWGHSGLFRLFTCFCSMFKGTRHYW